MGEGLSRNLKKQRNNMQKVEVSATGAEVGVSTSVLRRE